MAETKLGPYGGHHGTVSRKEPFENMAKSWTTEELKREARRFKAELEAAGMKDSTVHTYVDRAERFIKWLGGEYHPTTS